MFSAFVLRKTAALLIDVVLFRQVRATICRGASLSFQVKLYIQRLTSDHDATAMQLRRAVSFKDATKVHQACGAFLFFLSKLQDMAPESEFINMKTELYTQFNAGLLDADLQHAVENHVPASADLCTVAAFRPVSKQ